MSSMTDAMARMIKARVGLYTREPFFGTLALKLILVEDPKCESSWTDGKSLGFNPEKVIDAPMDVLEAVVAHHVMTCALGHPFRRSGRDSKMWNKASDIVVNGELIKAGFNLPEGSVTDPRFEGLHTEAVYSELDREQMQPPEGEGEGEGQGGQGQGSGASGSPQSDEDGDEGGDTPGEGEKPQDGAPGEPQDGPGNPETGEVRDAPAEEAEGEQASPQEMQEMEGDWQTAVAQAAQLSKGAGKLPGGVERAIKEMLDPKVDWREALQRLMRARSRDDLSKRRPNKRLMPFGIYAATLDAPKYGILAFAIDYSGSTSQRDIEQFSAEAEDARATLNPEKVVVMIFEDEVAQTLEFGPGEMIELPPIKAGGGTKFDGPVRKLEELEIEPEVLVYLTDLDSTVFADEPAYPVVWVTTRKTDAPYGEVIEMH